MSGYWNARPTPRGLGAFSITDIPIIGRAVDFANEKTRALIEGVLQKYAEFERAAMEAPAIKEDARRIYEVVSATGTPDQVVQAARYEQAAARLADESSNRGPVDFVVEWALKVKNAMGLSALPVIPLAVVSAAGVAAVVISNTIKYRNEAKLIRDLIAVGLTPEQVARLGTRGSPFKAGLAGFSGAITLIALGVGALFLMKTARGR